jgi:hypothetical protein
MEAGFLYAFSFLLVYTPLGVLGFVDKEKRAIVYQVMLVLNSIFLPLQGFFNLLVYTASDWLPVAQRWRRGLFSCSCIPFKQKNNAKYCTTSTGRGPHKSLNTCSQEVLDKNDDDGDDGDV